MKEIEIYCVNTDSKHKYPLGTSLLEISEDLKIQLDFMVCGAIVNNNIKELSFQIVKPKKIKFIDFSHPDGHRMYVRSLMFILFAAVKEILPDVSLKIQHGISNGYYCELEGLGRAVEEADIKLINTEMLGIIARDIPFVKKGLLTSEVIDIYTQQGLPAKAKLVEQMGHIFTFIYFLNGYANYYYGHLLPSTGYVNLFEVTPYFDGFLLKIPKRKKPDKLYRQIQQNKLFGIYQEHKDWAEILNVETIGSLNGFTMNGKSGDIIKISEALHEKKIAEIANLISNRKEDIKVVLVAGPSASGKTTFSKRLGVQLAVNGLRPFQISMDDYFVDREKTPKDENGEYDFEALKAIDIDFFNHQLVDLFAGNEVQLPSFDFTLGHKVFKGKTLKLQQGDILIIEGIHGMNPGLLTDIDPKNTFKIFLSALTQISFDEQNHISSADNRLLRRMIRDNSYRGYPAMETIKRWPSVRKGEEKNIFPFQENADVMFNSATIYELAVLKKYAAPLLEAVPENREEYNEANRLLRFLSYFKPIEDDEIPPTSLLREFLGGSSFVY